jgi:hypothetical protein
MAAPWSTPVGCRSGHEGPLRVDLSRPNRRLSNGRNRRTSVVAVRDDDRPSSEPSAAAPSGTGSHARHTAPNFAGSVFRCLGTFCLPRIAGGHPTSLGISMGYLVNEQKGILERVGTGPYPQSVFYASAGTYNLSHTCNTWTAEALRVAGLPVNAAGVVFAGQVLGQLPAIRAGSNS